MDPNNRRGHWWIALLVSIMFLMAVRAATGESGCGNCRCLGGPGPTINCEIVRAKEFSLIGMEGRSMGGMRAKDGESELWLNDVHGNRRIHLLVSNVDNIQHVLMSDSYGNDRLYLALDKLGSPRFSMYGDGDILGRGGSVSVKFDSGAVPNIQVFGPGSAVDRGQFSAVIEENHPPYVRAIRNRTVIDEWPESSLPAPHP